jgi:hypothetical protein
LRGTVRLRHRALDAAVLPGPPPSARDAQRQRSMSGTQDTIPGSPPPVNPPLHKQQGFGELSALVFSSCD